MIQKASKRFNQLQAELNWKIFSDLDTQDELEMLNLAVFMKTLIDTVPYEETEEDSRVPSIHLGKVGISRETIVCVDTYLDEYFEITTEQVDRSVVSAMIDFCRKGK